VEQVVGKGTKPVELAGLTGASVRAVQRRVRRAVDRLLSPETVYVLRHRDEWSARRAAVATAVWVHGLSRAEAAARLGMTPAEVRSESLAVLGLVAEGVRAVQRKEREAREVRERRDMVMHDREVRVA
jgi:DNA-directed RNA polymerase specialized sigma24 family protein